MEVFQHVLNQIEEKRGKKRGMTQEEFDLNKDLLREIITKKNEILNDIDQTKTDIQRKIDQIPKPAYDIFKN